ncbi:uncharacterized protein LOC134286966 [Aedes albopictus]|uniref:Integrase catalytic domain-containing protein n=1 Tax=Aedes albopictus TaxID=7160 RepID=A0ABM1YXP8_AEDAL
MNTQYGGGDMATGSGRSQAGTIAAGASRSHNPLSLPSIQLLQARDNWSTWRFAVQTFLELEDLWDAVKPGRNADGTFAEVDVMKDRRARGKIILLLDPVNYVHVKDVSTARETWSRLEAAFEDSGLTRKVGLLRKLISTTLENCASMEVFVNSIIATAHQLRGIGFDIGDEWIGTLLLAGLPEEYRPMIMAIENSGLKISADVIKTKLLQEVSIPSTGAAYAGKKQVWKQRQDANTKTASNGPKCRNCKKFGYIAKYCPVKVSKHENGKAWCTVLSTIAEDDQNWYFDSGASGHFTKTEELLENSRKCGGKVVAANKGAMNVVAKGTVKIYPECCPEDSPIEMHDVQIVKRGHEVKFSMDGVQVINPSGQVIATGSRHNDLFKLDQLVSRSRANELLELVHSDIGGPMEVSSLGGSRYYLTFTDDKSRKIWIYFLEEKSGESVYKAFENFRSMAEKQTGKQLKTLRTDNGKEFVNKRLEDHLQRLGIRHQTSADYTPEQNGLAERCNRTIVERARCMLFEAHLPKTFWAEAAATAVYLINRSPTKGHQMTPEEAWSGRKPDLAHVRIFGSPAMAHIPKQKRKKWDPKAFECVLTGFDEDTKAYRLWDPASRKLVKSRDVTFLSEQAQTVVQDVQIQVNHKSKIVSLDYVEVASYEPQPIQNAIEEPDEVTAVEAIDETMPRDETIITSDESDEEFQDDAVPTCSQHQVPFQQETLPLRRSGRERYLPDKLRDFFFPSRGLSSNRFSGDENETGDTMENSNRNMDLVTSQPQQGLVTMDNATGDSDPRTPAEA